jgi:hypothetical protein
MRLLGCVVGNRRLRLVGHSIVLSNTRNRIAKRP